jgi:hypothetical protein
MGGKGNLIPHILEFWIFSYGDSLAITIPGKTQVYFAML